MKRIKAGDVYNDYTLYVNGNPVKSNRVVTHTPEDPKPQKPSTPVPQPQEAQLPHTGEMASVGLAGLGAMLLGLGGLLGSVRRKKTEDID